MIRWSLALFPLVVSCGCVSPAASNGSRPPTLATHPYAPQAIIRSFYEDEQWERVRHLPYDALIVFQGTIQPDRTVRLTRVKEAYPNLSRERLARRLADHTRIMPLTVGSRTPSRAEIYVFFYEADRPGTEAIIVGQRIGGAAPASSSGGTFYLNHFRARSFETDDVSNPAPVDLVPRRVSKFDYTIEREDPITMKEDDNP